MLLAFAIFSESIYLFLLIKARESGLINLHNNQHLFWVIISLSLLFVIFYLAYFFLNFQKIKVKTIFLVVFVFQLTYLFIPYLSSNDLYSYIFTTRVNGIYAENPYFVKYDNFPQDPLYSKLETVWAHQTTLYGPLLLHIGGLINTIGQNNLIFLTIIFKALFIGVNLINTLLIYQISKSKRAVFLFAANPLVIFELAGNSHTESLTLLFLLLSFYFFKQRMASFTGFVLSVLIKYYTLIFLPFYLIRLLKDGLKPLSLSLGLGILITVSIYLPFWVGPQNFNYLMAYYYGEYISPSPFIYLGQKLLGSYQLSFQINTAIFLLITLILMYKFMCSRAGFKEFLFYSFLLYWAYILTKSSLILPWYLILLILLGSLCIAFKEYQKYAIISITFVSIYSLMLYYFVR